MGGGLSHYLACNGADVFASVAPAAFDLLQDSEEPCHPSRPITVMSFRGTADPIVPYDGGASTPPNGLNVTIHFLGAQGTFQEMVPARRVHGHPKRPGQQRLLHVLAMPGRRGSDVVHNARRRTRDREPAARLGDAQEAPDALKAYAVRLPARL